MGEQIAPDIKHRSLANAGEQQTVEIVEKGIKKNDAHEDRHNKIQEREPAGTDERVSDSAKHAVYGVIGQHVVERKLHRPGLEHIEGYPRDEGEKQ
jgi:hypothetical protein